MAAGSTTPPSAPICSAATRAAALRRRRGLPYGKVPRRRSRRSTRPGELRAGPLLDVDAAGRRSTTTHHRRSPHPRIAFTVAPEPPRWPLLIVCEGMPGAFTAAQAGYRSIGLLGAQAPDETVAARVANHAERHDLDVVLMTDANDAGRTAGDRLADLLRAEHVDPVIVEPPADLADAAGEPVVDLNAWAQLDPDWSDDLLAALDLGHSPTGAARSPPAARPSRRRHHRPFTTGARYRMNDPHRPLHPSLRSALSDTAHGSEPPSRDPTIIDIPEGGSDECAVRDGPAQRSGDDTTSGVVCEFRVAVDGQRRLWLPWSPGASSPAPASAISTPAAGWPSAASCASTSSSSRR